MQVMFGTDLSKVKKILLDLLASDERILKQPAPIVELVDLKNSTVDLRIYFWVVENDIAMPLPES